MSHIARIVIYCAAPCDVKALTEFESFCHNDVHTKSRACFASCGIKFCFELNVFPHVPHSISPQFLSCSFFRLNDLKHLPHLEQGCGISIPRWPASLYACKMEKEN